jgi:hypothetical protein
MQIRIRSRRAVVSTTGEWYVSLASFSFTAFHTLAEQKLYSHTEAAVKWREKGIQNLAFEYNKQCAKVAQLIRDKNAS